MYYYIIDIVAEWLRRWTANPFPYGIAGSNPADVVLFIYSYIFYIYINKCMIMIIY